MTPSRVLGLSAWYHDSAAALVEDGALVAAAQEERFSRKKHDERFPARSVAYCLSNANISLAEVDCVVFYEKPFIKLERLLETYLDAAPRGLRSYLTAMPAWLSGKLQMKQALKRELAHVSGLRIGELPPLLFTEHHRSHAASAFYPSPFERAAVLCMDGVGEWATTSVWLGEGNRLEPKWQLDFPHSLGLLYSAFTFHAGFKVNSGEYKLMGLAPYGEPRFASAILEHLIDLKDDGTFRLDLTCFDFAAGLKMTNAKFSRLFGGPPRQPETRIAQREMDLARSIQDVTEQIVLRLARTIRRELDVDRLCLAGGVALNCVANGALLRSGIFRDLFIQPAAGDAGGAAGAAFVGWHEHLGNARDLARRGPALDGMSGAYLGPEASDGEIRACLDRWHANYLRLDDDALFTQVAGHLAEGAVVGWYSGRAEFGPRALGNRSILGDPRNPKMQSVMNLKIKLRESFRPFAPAVMAEHASEYFDLDRPSPYMLLTAPVRESLRTAPLADQQHLTGIDRLPLLRSTIPAVTHVDHSARVQTVHAETNPRFYRLLAELRRQTGCAVLVNTSFNVRGEPIVGSPEDALRCFLTTEMDFLALGNFLLAKSAQTRGAGDPNWKSAAALD